MYYAYLNKIILHLNKYYSYCILIACKILSLNCIKSILFHRELGHSSTPNCQSTVHPFLTPTHMITTSFNSNRSYLSLRFRVYSLYH